jgi:hypothetical protein
MTTACSAVANIRLGYSGKGEPTSGLKNRLPLLQLRVTIHVLQGPAGFASPAFLSGFLCSALPRVAPYCVPGSVSEKT